MKVYGRKNIPSKGAVILASNHASYLDPLILGAVVNRQVEYMAKDTLFRGKRSLRWWLESVGVFPVKRNAMDLGAVKEAFRRLQNGRVLGLFPEGTRSKDGQLRKIEYGVGFFSIKASVPVVPVYIAGSNKILPKDSKKMKSGKVDVYFGKAIDPVSFDHRDGKDNYARFSREIMERIEELSSQNG